MYLKILNFNTIQNIFTKYGKYNLNPWCWVTALSTVVLF